MRTRSGYTIVELMVTIVIVAVLAATVGTFVVKLLTLQEKEREEAYIRERLADICGIYADRLSLGSSVCTNLSDRDFVVTYRQEAGGVSFETGCVSRVARVDLSEKVYKSSNWAFKNLLLNVDTVAVDGGLEPKLANEFWGADTPLVTTKDLKVDSRVNLSCNLVPLNDSSENAALWSLEVRADYWVKNDKGVLEPKNTVASRIVRLWNVEDFK